FLEYRGSYQDHTSINENWQQLEAYALAQNLLSERSIFMTEIIDDEQIGDQIRSRYNSAFILDQPLSFEPTGLFRTRKHQRQKYVKFIHQGNLESSFAFYTQIYAFWIFDIDLEITDGPILEFYPNYAEVTSDQELITEIYIPVH
ncbi:MAG: GyrI-like domain-containing protein, partial [Bacteroidota bacterium]